MAKFCTECGKEIPAGVAFCTECGAKAPADPTAAEAVTGKVVPPVVHTPPAQSYQAQQTYTQPAPDPTSKAVSTGAYFGLMLLFAIPIIGFIACIIMTFAPKNQNLKHFAKATLIWMIISIVLTGILITIVAVLMDSFIDYLSQLTDGVFSDFGDLFGQLGDLEGLMEQVGNGGLESLPIE